MIKLFKDKETKNGKLIEFAFRKGGKNFYQFKDLLDMPYKRYQACRMFASEVNLRIDNKTLRESMQQAIDLIVNEKNATKAVKILMTIQEKAEIPLTFEPSYRLCSAVYFYYGENVDDYDYAVGDEKIDIFKKEGLDSFFFSEPTRNYITGIDLLNTDLASCLKLEKDIEKKLLSVLKMNS